jgi:predicted nucleotidyltransferase
MNLQETAAWEAHTFLLHVGIPYAIIGGLAVQWWGEPRLTKDVDLTVIAPLDEPERFIEQVTTSFMPRIDDAVTFARRNRVILVRASNGCPLDISLGLPGYEDEVMQRAVEVELEPGKAVRVCSAEDLIIHKAIAGRPQDVRDAEGIVYRQREGLDAAYIRTWLQAFADLLDNPEIIQRFESPWQRIHTR